MLTQPHEPNRSGSTPAVPTGCFKEKGSSVAHSYSSTNLSLHINVELLDTLEGELFFLHQDANGVPHELLGDLQHVCRHGGWEQHHLEEEEHVTQTTTTFLLCSVSCRSDCSTVPWDGGQWTLRKRFHHISFSAQCTIISFRAILCWHYRMKQKAWITRLQQISVDAEGCCFDRSPSKQTYLNICAQFLEDLIDLILEPSTQHLISFIQNKHLNPFWGCGENEKNT